MYLNDLRAFCFHNYNKHASGQTLQDTMFPEKTAALKPRKFPLFMYETQKIEQGLWQTSYKTSLPKVEKIDPSFSSPGVIP